MELITSKHNPKVQLARSLLLTKARKKRGLFLVDGLRHVGAALESNFPLEFLLWAPARLSSDFGRRLIASARARGIPVFAVDEALLDGISPRDQSQGIIAVARPRRASLDSLSPATHKLLVAMVAPQLPGNVGTILRTMDAVAADALILLDGGTDPYHPNSVRASMGAIFWLPVVKATCDEMAAWAHARGYTLVGTSAHGGVDYRKASYPCPTVLVLGREREGLSVRQRSMCDRMVTIPMQGHGSSLNLAVAAGVLLYEMSSHCRE